MPRQDQNCVRRQRRGGAMQRTGGGGCQVGGQAHRGVRLSSQGRASACAGMTHRTPRLFPQNRRRREKNHRRARGRFAAPRRLRLHRGQAAGRDRAGMDADRLRASPNFALAAGMDGRPFIAKDSEPYVQYWLSGRERLLFALFGRRRGLTVAAARAAYRRLADVPDTPLLRRRLDADIAGMRAAGVLVGAGDDLSRYDAGIAEAYLTHRPFPPEIAARIRADAALGPGQAVLDLAGGPGDLALQLAASGAAVTLLDLSRGFLDAARRRAAAQGLPLGLLQDSANRLLHLDAEFDVVTVAQALHWLDDVQVCRGLCRVLRPGGSVFVVHGALSVPDRHPLAHLFGHRSILGAKEERPFAEEAAALHRRLSLLFEALDSPGVDRIDLARPQAGAGWIRARRLSLFRQPRPIGPGFARAFLTDSHIARTGLAPEAFWQDIAARCAGAPADRLAGLCDWALLHFQRSEGLEHAPLGRPEAIPIGYAGPASG
ncbi:class I SAM-dependent methyltransferase [Paracraurococcus ruber]|nr:class I SAM-dependent methyltransferase [Paracraurococcus ruber]